ncbi:clathrin light chain B-like isoform X2 [Mizuhopecten yessoensis]|uniref:Clathrin light chain n=1 Tax=Mizuhopecten yessoensis TaxID=6573 RepID=A0A210PUI4_MIZYE|nr:clathrin light chain B-like isoform X2 [Mizuhopecten yessoensis]OWF40148.1 Clathrin light chain A [Mizuhopecten yessoensis]
MADADFMNPEPTEEDPAAAFLAREQTELAGLEDDNFGVDSSAPQQQNDNFDPFTGGASEQQEGDFMGNQEFETTNQQQDSEENMMSGGSGGGLVDFDVSPPLVDAEEQNTNAPPDMYSIISQADRERNEPEKIRIWREEQVLKLEAKDKEEDNKQEEMRDSAKKELDDWYKHNLEQLEKTKENNRAAEEAFVKDRDETQPGGEWEKICRLCEFNPKNSKNTKDVSRMRGILLQLKQTPLVR